MDEFKIIIKKQLTSMLAHLNKFYYKINLFLKKYQTINKLYEPKLNEKIGVNSLLCSKIKEIKSTNLKLNKKIKTVEQENIALQKKINLMQELIIRK